MYLANVVLARDDGRKLQLRLNTQFLILIMDELAAECTEDCTEATLWWPVLGDNVSNAAAFLASPLASARTGTVIYVDNGPGS